MSNFLAIATVTAALRRTVQAAIDRDVPGAKVTTVRPDHAANGNAASGANIFLYQTTPNAAWRNSDLPTRNADGQTMQRPRAALDLHYLVTLFGDESRLEPQRLLGSVARTLHAKPLLTRDMVQTTIVDPTFDFLSASNLANDVDLVRFTPMALSLEDLSKLWSVFFQTPYTLSVAYQASVVLIESDDETPRTVLPVREPKVYAVPFRHPVVDDVQPLAGAGEPIMADSVLVIKGSQLRGDKTRIKSGNQEVDPDSVSDTQISVKLSKFGEPLLAGAGVALQAGVHAVQVVQKMKLGDPPTDHNGFESNIAAFILRPTIKAAPTFTKPTITFTLDPKVGPKQRVVMLLNELNALDANKPVAYSFIVPARTGNVPTDKIAVDMPSVKAGTYLVRVQVDGAESVPVRDSDKNSATVNQYIGPTVKVP